MSLIRPTLVLGALALLALTAPQARAAAGPAALARLAPLKRMEALLLAREPMREKHERKEHLRELRRLARQLRTSGQSSIVVRGLRSQPDLALDEASPAGAPTPERRAQPLSVNGPPRPNVRVNNPTSPTVDGANDGQCETSLAVYGNNMVAAWNDGYGFDAGASTTDTQGWATSTDGGVTWTDQGTLPHPGAYASWVWTSDPVVAVNPNTGVFYYSGLADATPTVSATGVTKGRFVGTTFIWDVVSAANTTPASSNFIDKEWVAVNPANGRVCLSYTMFPGTGAEIHFQSADSALVAWTPTIKITDVSENGLCQGSRPIAMPNGDILVEYYFIGPIDVDYFKVRKSVNGGVSFGAPGLFSFYSNFGSGAPGFNRASGIQFAGCAVDRSGGAHNGRLYLSFAEALNWYDDEPNIGGGGNVSEDTLETNANNTAATATPAAVGKILRGKIGATTDLDYYAITLSAGQTMIAECDSADGAAAYTMRLFASDGTTRLAFTTINAADLAAGYHPLWVVTAPFTGTYYLRVAYNGGMGTYRIKTGTAARAGERGSDARDVFVAYSDNEGANWTINRVDTAPTGFDGWLPEVAAALDGHVYCVWFDWRDATAASCGGQSNVYLARSDDGGGSWVELGATTDAMTSWTSVSTNIQPNQGDYQSLFADNAHVIACWSDGRDGNPNVYMANWTIAETPVEMSLVSASAFSNRVELSWWVASPAGIVATVYRREGPAAPWVAEGSISPDGTGALAWTDYAVTPGATYDYRLGVQQNGSEAFYGQASVTVPSGIAFALAGVHPNPARAGALVDFSLASDDPATLTLLDVGGRAVERRDVGSLGAGRHQLELASGRPLPPGVYLLSLSQRGRTLTTRVNFVR